MIMKITIIMMKITIIMMKITIIMMTMYCFSIGLWKNPSDTPHDLLASGSRDCSVKIWNMKEGSGVAVATCHGHNGPINCISFGDNSFLASASEDCSVRIWRISTV